MGVFDLAYLFFNFHRVSTQIFFLIGIKFCLNSKFDQLVNMNNTRFYILVRIGAMCQNRMPRSNQLITSTPKPLRKFHSSKSSSVLRVPSSNEQEITEQLVNIELG